MNALFTYGSLMCEDIMFRVAGACQVAGDAVLDGFRCLSVCDEEYPAIAPRENAVTRGVLYRNIAADGWRKLDDFEGEMYERRSVTVKLISGEEVSADTYVFRSEFHYLLTDLDWRFETFLKQGKQRFIEKYIGFKKI